MSPVEQTAQLCAARPKLVAYMRKLTGNTHDAEDMAQEAIMKAFTNLHEFRYGNIRAWLFVIARNTWLTACKASTACKRTLPVGELSSLTEELQESRLDEYEALSQKLERVAAALPAEQVSIFAELVKGCSYDEIAAAHGLPLGTVKSRIHRARAKIEALAHA
jgi:RNA polymerase sigma-70 factor (ECF subfamily)